MNVSKTDNWTRCAVIRCGNIGTDPLMKPQRSPVREPAWMVAHTDPAGDRQLGATATVMRQSARNEASTRRQRPC